MLSMDGLMISSNILFSFKD